jgi:hypothetical protein
MFRSPLLPKISEQVSEVEDVDVDESIYQTLPLSAQTYQHVQEVSTLPDVPRELNTLDVQNKSKDLQHILLDLTHAKGFIAAALADATSGIPLATLNVKDFDIEAAVSANSQVIRCKLDALHALGFDKEDGVEDILITLNSQYHLIRMSKKNPSIFIYMALEKAQANLVLARRALAKTEKLLNAMS